MPCMFFFLQDDDDVRHLYRPHSRIPKKSKRKPKKKQKKQKGKTKYLHLYVELYMYINGYIIKGYFR